MDQNIYWHAVYTKPRWEKKVAALLEVKGIEYYCPLNKVIKQWSDRKKVVLEPLFKSYVFVQVADEKKWELLHINGIINYVSWLGKPAKIKESEIATIRKFLNEFDAVEITEDALEVNRQVKVKQGILMNYQGILVSISGKRASVRIESMGIQLTTIIDTKNLEIVTKNTATAKIDHITK
jgi:transcription antitermination factor NusG